MGDLGSIPGLERPPGEGGGYPLQYSGLENSMDCLVHSPWGCKQLDMTEQLSLSLFPTYYDYSSLLLPWQKQNIISRMSN